MTLNHRISMSRLRGALAAAALAALLPAAGAQAELPRLEIIAPAAAGGGWDQTARALQASMQAQKQARRIQVMNIPGAGGTIGLAQFVSSKKGSGDTMMVFGFVMTGAIITNKSAVTLDSVKPLARLIGEYEAIAVPADSPLKSMGDLVAKLKEDTASVSWGGGSAGGTDHILVGLIAKAAGADASKVNYIAHSGGGEMMTAVLGGHVTAGVSGLAEILPQAQAGKLRILAISSDQRIPGQDLPTLKEQGIDVAVTNWRGLVAPPEISDAEFQALAAAVDATVKSESWKKELADHGWLDLYQPAAEFAPFLAADNAKVAATLKDIGLVK